MSGSSKNNKQLKCASCGGKLVKIGDGLYKCSLCGKKKRVEEEREPLQKESIAFESENVRTADTEKGKAEKTPEKKKSSKVAGAGAAPANGKKTAEKTENAPEAVPGKETTKKNPQSKKKGTKQPFPHKKYPKAEKAKVDMPVAPEEPAPSPSPIPKAEPEKADRALEPQKRPYDDEPFEDVDIVIPPFPYVRTEGLKEVPASPDMELKIGGFKPICGVEERLYAGGVKDGEGSFTCPDGTRYEGGLRDGLRFGKGRTEYGSGDAYEGEYDRDAACGKGIMTKSDGTMYAGMFDGDIWCGKGIYRDLYQYLHVGVFGYKTFEGNTYLPDENAITEDELYNEVESWFGDES
ncbi:MAG: hypothetical protein LUD29_04975 [Clostridia bacterium]|nr:hypothetical protein [Clostridia bacterium]